MRSSLCRFAVALVAAAGVGTVARAQPADWIFECGPSEDFVSDPYLLNAVSNELMTFAIGFSGTSAWGGTETVGGGTVQLGCFFNRQTVPNRGKFAISTGSVGSIQQSSGQFEDAFMTMTVGAPFTPAWTYANTTFNGAKTYFPAADYADFFFGESNRYLIASSDQGQVFARLQIELVADAVRLRWTLTNNSDAAANIGLQWGSALGMLLNGFAESSTGANLAHWAVGTNGGRQPAAGYVYVPGRRPPTQDTIIDRGADPSEFPDFIDFVFSQEDAFGLRVQNTPDEATQDFSTFQGRLINQPTPADRVTLGANIPMLGQITDTAPTLPGGQRTDRTFLGSTAFIQRFEPQTIGPGASRTVLHYIRGTWGNGNYALPYGAVVDAPQVIQNRETNFNGTPADGDLVPNPFKIRVWVDNVGGPPDTGFGTVGNEIALQDVRVKLTFGAGLGITPIGANQKTINTVPPREMRFIEFDARADEETVGDVPYTVEIKSEPGGVTKIINGVIHVAGRPRVTLYKDANLIGVPYSFADTSWDNILSPFQDPNVSGGNAQVFEYDPLQQGYVVSTSQRRGIGTFVIYEKDGGDAPVRDTFGGSPQRPSPTSDPLIQLRRGWNLIANPYNYRMYVNQFIGVPSDPLNQRAMKWSELVDLGIVANFLAFFDPETDQYDFVDGTTGFLEPNRGYWILVEGTDELSLQFPELFEEFVPGATRSRPQPVSQAWPQNEDRWRLNLVARSQTAIDAQNYVGAAATAKSAKSLTIFEPPAFPNQELMLFVESQKDGKPVRMAQSILDRASNLEWKVVADVRKPGAVTLTWPNLSQAPKDMRFRLIDVATGMARDLRQVSGYTFRMENAGTREFRIEASAGFESRPVIANVVVTRPTRAANAPFTINYTLSADANTSVRVLSASGREVFTVSRGRADRAGENSVTWMLRDNANRAVAPGTYRIEIVAETTSGERVRKIVPVTVVR